MPENNALPHRESASWEPTQADEFLHQALSGVRDRLLAKERRFIDIREEDLRTALHDELDARLPGRVRKERRLTLVSFQGVGPFDLLVDRVAGGRVDWLGETKWSYTARDKIFEGAWDAVKLILAQAELGVSRGWLITGASEGDWGKTECADLFHDGAVDVQELWARRLAAPGPNGGTTVGEDLFEGGRGNVFTRAPKEIRITAVATELLIRPAERWSLRASAVSAEGDWIEDFASAPQFPAMITQRWLDANVPRLTDEEYAALLVRLRRKRWTEDDLRRRVYPLRGVSSV